MSEQGPFQRREGEQSDASARWILIGMGLAGIFLFVLFASPFSFLSGDDDSPGDGATITATGDGRSPGVPDGYEVLSTLNDDLRQATGAQGPFVLTVPLLQQVSDGRNLGLYSFTNGRWTRIAPATLVSNGREATGEVGELPPNVAVLRVLESPVQITGRLPAGAQLDGEAAQVLTTVNPADFAPSPEGGVVGTSRSLDGFSGNVVPTVRADDADDDAAVEAILASPALTDQHVTALVQLALQPGNAGVDIDYPRVSAARRADFAGFITMLAGQLHQANRTLSVTLPSPTRSGVSWDTGAYDWETIVAQADLVKLLPQQDPALFYQSTNDVLAFLSSREVNLRKVALVVSRESYERGSEGLTAMSLHQALALAGEIEVRTASAITPNSAVVIVGRNIFLDDGASGLVWDEDALAVSFDYPGRGGTRTVWLENSLSLAFKLELASRYDLGGVSISDVSNNPGHVRFWAPVREYSETGSVQPAAANGQMLRPAWQVQAGNPQPEPKGNLVWTAPAQPGTYEVTLIISDGVIRAAQSIQLEVQAPAP